MSLKQNIIYIYFKGKHQVTSKSQYQYNRGQYLYFADLNLPQAFEVHFSNKDKGESKTQIGSDNLVEIPDEYFWNGALQIYAWIYLHSETTDGETIYEVRIPLTKRAKPTDEEPLPVQQSTIDRAIAELNNAVDITTENANKTDSDKIIVSNIKEDVITLKENIDSTATIINQKAQETIDASERVEISAQNAATSENKALNYSQQAEQSAQSALESKNIAQQKSEVATNASNEALGYRNEALEVKNQAVQAKQNIVDYRDETKGYRDETLNLKNNVQTLKNQIDETSEEIEGISSTVNENAQSASQSASSASQSANSASQSANSASQSANEAEQYKNQSATNVTHYPKVVDGYWYVWDASKNEYVNTNVDARGVKGDKGDVGNGIENTVLNSDYTLTITFTDGTSYTTPSIRGEKGIKGDVGNGIASTVLNDDYTLTITFTDGTTYKTPSIRGEKGEKGEPATDMEIHICSITEYDAETRMPTIANPNSSTFYLVPTEDGTSPDLFTEWVYVNGAWEMFGSAKIDLSGYLTDVQIDGTSIVTDGVANVPTATASTFGAIRTNANYGTLITYSGHLGIATASSAQIKNGDFSVFGNYKAVSILHQHESTFYGLAKSAGADEKDSTLPVGNYTDNAKDKIQTMLGITPLIAPHETDPFESNHVVGELFIINGKLYRAKTALTAGEYINEGTNVEVVSVADVVDEKVSDVQVNGVSIVDNGIAKIPYASNGNQYGVISIGATNGWYGLYINSAGIPMIEKSSEVEIKKSSNTYKPIVPANQHIATFYGLAKIAGHDEKDSTLPVGTYTPEAKSAIKQMLSIADNYDSFIVDVEGTDPTITGQPSYRYNCGEVLSLTVTPPETGTIDFRFTSGSSPTVLTLPSTVKMPEWWVEVEANTIYEMCITDGIYCGVMTWAI